MPSGSRSLGGAAIVAGLTPVAGSVGIAPVMSLAAIGDAAAGGGIKIRALSSVFGPEELFDCFSTGVGEIIEGAMGDGIAGLAPFSAGACAGPAGSTEFSIGGICGALPVSSSVIAVLKVPSTITTTLAPTSSERILDEMFEGVLVVGLDLVLPLGAALEAALAAERPAFSGGGAAAAACAARRAAAMKLDELTGSLGPAAISLIALSEAAIRSDGEDIRAAGRVPGSSG